MEGAEKNAFNLGIEFSNKYQIRYLKFYDFKNEYKVNNIVHSHKEQPQKSFLSKLLFTFKRIKFIKEIIKTYRPNVVISFGFYSNILTSISSLKRNYKVILSVRSDILKQPFFIKKISRYLYNKMDCTHAITKVMVKNLTLIGIKNIVHIYNGHDFRSYKKLAEEDIACHFLNNKFIYLNIGRLTYAKGHWHLIKAFSISARRDKNIFLVIIGEGELEDELRHLIKILDIEDRVAILANTSNIFPYLKRANCFLSQAFTKACQMFL